MNEGTKNWLDILEKRAVSMRENPTRSEKKMAEILDSLKIEYVQQYVFGTYIADFYLPKYNKVIEVNGDSHIGKEEYDLNRAAYFLKYDIRILNIKAHEVYKSAYKIKKFLQPKQVKSEPQKKQPKQHKEKTFYIGSNAQKILDRYKKGKYKSLKAFNAAYTKAVQKDR